MVMVKTVCENPPQISLIENDDVVKALASDRARETFAIRILPATPGFRTAPSGLVGPVHALSPTVVPASVSVEVEIRVVDRQDV